MAGLPNAPGNPWMQVGQYDYSVNPQDPNWEWGYNPTPGTAGYGMYNYSDPSTGYATNWGNSPQSQQATANSAANTNAAAAPQTITPATIQGQFPGGIPQQTASGVGNVPAVMSQNVNPTYVDPNMSIAATEAYLQPQFAQQQSALTANLANAGIVGGTAPQAAAQLGQQQQTTLQNDIQPFLQQGALANQSTNLAAQTTNAGNNLAAQTTNAGNTLQGSEYNASAANQAQQFNIQNLLQTGQIDAATYNAMMSQVMGYQNTDWLAQLNAQTTTTNQNANNQTNAFQPVYQQPSSTNLSGVGAAAGSAFQVPKQPQPTTNTSNFYNVGSTTVPGGGNNQGTAVNGTNELYQ